MNENSKRKHPQRWSRNNIISLSEKGLNVTTWGTLTWNFLLSLASNVKIHPHFTLFLFKQCFSRSGPCPHCRKSHYHFTCRPELSFDVLVLGCDEAKSQPKMYISDYRQNLVRWLILLKQYVNTKLNKPIMPLEQLEFGFWSNSHFKNMWANYFFFWLYSQILVYTPRKSQSESPDIYLHYVYLITQIKFILPKNHYMSIAWMHAYLHNPPNRRTFYDRESLFLWCYKTHMMCLRWIDTYSDRSIEDHTSQLHCDVEMYGFEFKSLSGSRTSRESRSKSSWTPPISARELGHQLEEMRATSCTDTCK